VASDPIQGCFTFHDFRLPEDGFTYAYFDIVKAGTDFKTFTPLGLEVPYSREVMGACVNITSSEDSFFPAMFVPRYLLDLLGFGLANL
jgi:hypothetical protein